MSMYVRTYVRTYVWMERNGTERNGMEWNGSCMHDKPRRAYVLNKRSQTKFRNVTRSFFKNVKTSRLDGGPVSQVSTTSGGCDAVTNMRQLGTIEVRMRAARPQKPRCRPGVVWPRGAPGANFSWENHRKNHRHPFKVDGCWFSLIMFNRFFLLKMHILKEYPHFWINWNVVIPQLELYLTLLYPVLMIGMAMNHLEKGRYPLFKGTSSFSGLT